MRWRRPARRPWVRLLPGFDPYVNELPRRTETLLPIARHDLVYRTAGWITPVVIIGGRVAGTWDLDHGGVSVQPFEAWRSSVRMELAAEVDRYAAFLDRWLTVTISRPLGA